MWSFSANKICSSWSSESILILIVLWIRQIWLTCCVKFIEYKIHLFYYWWMDCIFRENKMIWSSEKYLDFLRNLLKTETMSGLLIWQEFFQSKVRFSFCIKYVWRIFHDQSGALAEYVGLLENEVKVLCKTIWYEFQDTKCWYDGYFWKIGHVYNPRSVVSAMLSHSLIITGTKQKHSRLCETILLWIIRAWKKLLSNYLPEKDWQ